MTQSKCVSELLDNLLSEWDSVLTHINIKRIKNTKFQVDLENPNVLICEIDFAISYSCEYQSL